MSLLTGYVVGRSVSADGANISGAICSNGEARTAKRAWSLLLSMVFGAVCMQVGRAISYFYIYPYSVGLFGRYTPRGYVYTILYTIHIQYNIYKITYNPYKNRYSTHLFHCYRVIPAPVVSAYWVRDSPRLYYLPPQFIPTYTYPLIYTILTPIHAHYSIITLFHNVRIIRARIS